LSALGAFTFVLHSHLPYVRLAGRWPHGEEWIHEAAVETYIPLLDTLYTLKEEGVNFRLNIGITPVLAEQLADPDVLDHLDHYLNERIEAARGDTVYFAQPETADPALAELAAWYLNGYEKVKAAFHTRFNRDLIGAFRRLQDEGFIELLSSVATHAYLPLLSSDSSIQAQFKTGLASHRRLFGGTSRAAWLPECAYRPAYITETGRQRPGLEHFLAANGLNLFFSETHMLTGGAPVGIAAGDAIGPYGQIKRRYVMTPRTIIPERPITTFYAYNVADTLSGSDEQPSGVAVIGRNKRVGEQVWSSEWGYPGDFDYREFHRRSATSGLKYWRVTGVGIELGRKDIYHPQWATMKVEQHAEHFAHLVGDQLRYFHNETGGYGLVAANYDTELFGHWWYEGVEWLGQVLRHLANTPEVEMTTASNYLAKYDPIRTVSLPESSWGMGGTHFAWDNPETHWMWTPIHEAEARMEALANRYDDPTPDEALVLAQAAREALLMQSSDWPFLVTTGQAREYAIDRFSRHADRFNKLVSSLESGRPDADQARALYEEDKLFPDIDYRWFRTYTG
jgi:1,4-alpha-glucan branching enzyme